MSIRPLTYVVIVVFVGISLILAWPEIFDAKGSFVLSGEVRAALFAEAIGAAITVGVIDRLLRIEASQRNRPARFAAFREASLVYSRARALWFAIINSAFDPARHGELVMAASTLLDPNLGTVMADLDLDAEAPVVPKRTWRIHIHQQVTELEERIGRCLQQFAAYMEPQMNVALQNLERSPFIVFAKMVPTMAQIGTELGVRYGSRFGFGVNGTASDFVASLKTLSNLLKHEAPEFKRLLPDGSPTHFDLSDELKALRSKIGK